MDKRYMSGIQTKNGKFTIRGTRKDVVIGRSSFKTANALSNAFRSTGANKQAWFDHVRRWIGHNQELFRREDVVLRVFNETQGWGPIKPSQGMFGSPPNDVGIWNVPELQNIASRGGRVQRLTPLNRNVLRWMFRESHRTGICWEIVIDATLKHTRGLTTSIVDHVIRQTAVHMRKMQKRFPNAAVIVSARNEWDAHNVMRTRLDEVNAWATRWYRWKKPGTKQENVSFKSPGEGWVPEQWPECLLIVDHGGRNSFDYRAGTGPGVFQAGMVHLQRGRGWEKTDIRTVRALRRASRGAPIGTPESMYSVDKRDHERAQRWYRGPDGWTSSLNLYMRFLEDTISKFDYVIVHDEKGAQSDASWPRQITSLEEAIEDVL